MPAANSSNYNCMPKRKEPPVPPKGQVKRLVEAERNRLADESREEFERRSGRAGTSFSVGWEVLVSTDPGAASGTQPGALACRPHCE
jgi:hypothetical protein